MPYHNDAHHGTVIPTFEQSLKTCFSDNHLNLSTISIDSDTMVKVIS